MAAADRSQGGHGGRLRRWWSRRNEPRPSPMFHRFTNGARHVVVLTEFSAKRRGSARVELSDLLVGLLLADTDEPGGVVLLDAGLTADGLHPTAPGYEDSTWERFAGVRVPFAPDLTTALVASQSASQQAGHEVIAPLHLLLGALAVPGNASRTLLRARGVDPDQLEADARAMLAVTQLPGPGAPMHTTG